jgi:hypothetical protein
VGNGADETGRYLRRSKDRTRPVGKVAATLVSMLRARSGAVAACELVHEGDSDESDEEF